MNTNLLHILHDKIINLILKIKLPDDLEDSYLDSIQLPDKYYQKV